MRTRSVDTLDALVVALCLDYERRAKAIDLSSASRRTDIEYKYLNFKIYNAVAEISGDALAHTYINEIGNKIGYAKSEIDELSEVTYKNYKRLMKENIAKKLHLCD